MNRIDEQFLDDAQNSFDLLTDVGMEKAQFIPKSGDRIYWYYVDDLRYAQENGNDVRDDQPYAGIIVPLPNIDMGGELDLEDCVVVMDRYPAQKSYCETDWVMLPRLLRQNDLIEVYKSNC